MSKITIYINPACSNCRNTLQLLEERGIKPEIIEYLQTPPSKNELAHILEMGVSAKDLIRTKEAAWQELGLDLDNTSDQDLIDAIVANPIIMQRPVAIYGDKAIVSRPPEKILEIL